MKLSDALALQKKKKSKYRSVAVRTSDGYFHSKGEARRWEELKLIEAAGVIRNLSRQKTFALVVNDILICKYHCDFVYEERLGNDWAEIIEDYKGMRTREYIMKRRLMKAIHGIEIRETGR